MLAMTGCSQSSGVIPLEKIPDTYSLEQVKEDGCVTHENGDVTQGKEKLEAFFDNTLAGKTDEIRLAFYYTLKESNHRGLKDDEQVEKPNGSVQTEVIYVLTHDDSVTWQEILRGIVSSKYGDFIDHLTICIEVYQY